MTEESIAIIALFAFISISLFMTLVCRTNQLLRSKSKEVELEKRLTDLLDQLS